MAAWSDWSPIKSDWSIPADLLPATEWQLRFYVHIEYDIVDAERMYETVNGKWRWQINAADTETIGPDGKPVIEYGDLLFNQENQVRVVVNWQSIGFGISMVSWYWDQSGDKIKTIFPDPPPTLGAEDAYLNPGSDPAPTFADPTVYIDTWREQGTIYQIPLPIGAKLRVPFRNITAWLIKAAHVQIRTKRGGGLAVRDPYQGIAWVVDSKGSGFSLSSIRSNGLPGPFQAVVGGAGSPKAILRLPRSTRLVVITQQASGLVAWESAAEGQEGTWRKLADLASGTLMGACVTEDGGAIILIVLVSGKPHVMRCDMPGGTIPPAEAGAVETAVVNATDLGEATGLDLQTISVLVEQFGKLRVVGTVGKFIKHFTSSDGGVTWA